MEKEVMQFVAAHTHGMVALVAGFGIRHYWPMLWPYISQQGTDKAVFSTLEVLKKAAKNHGATDQEIKDIEAKVAAVVARASTDLSQDADK